MIVTVIGMSALLAARLERQALRGASNAADALQYAESGIDLAMLKISQDPLWRQTYTHDTWTTDQDIGRGTFRWKLVDLVDTDLSNNPNDPIKLVAWSSLEQTTQKISVHLEAIGQPLSCLAAAAHVGGNIEISTSDDTITVIDAPLSTNAQLNNNGTVNANVEANATSGTGTINGTINTPSPPKELPSSDAVLNFYTLNGTLIEYSSLPAILGIRIIENIVLSPNNNPWGTTNPKGIYVINCQFGPLTIQNCRIVGTLVLLNPGIFSEIEESIHWEPAISNYPALIVKGHITIKLNSTDLDEALTANFNPPGTPYPYNGGTDDTLQDDLYPSQISGLIYSSDLLTIGNNTTINGIILANNLIRTRSLVTDTVNLTYNNIYFNNPPPGFTGGDQIRIVPASWARAVD